MFIRAAVAYLAASLVAVVSFAGGVPESHLEEYGRGIIENYTDMTESESIEYLWIAPDASIHDHHIVIESIENLTLLHDRKLMRMLEEDLEDALIRAANRDEKAPKLTVKVAVFWAQRSNRAKWLIPYAGLHLAQAGLGMELVFRAENGDLVAKVRHSGREGDKLEDAGVELIDDLAEFVHTH